jgi:hypothetical protein
VGLGSAGVAPKRWAKPIPELSSVMDGVAELWIAELADSPRFDKVEEVREVRL